MKLAIVRQTYNPNGGAERFVSRALNVLAQDTSLDVTLIARQWENAAGWQTLTVNPPFRNRVARESGFATVRAEGARRVYALDPSPLKEVDAWLDRFRIFWTHRLEALATEVARGKRARRTRD